MQDEQLQELQANRMAVALTEPQLQQIVQNAVTAALTAVQAAQVQAPQAVPFVLVPGGGNANQPWDFTTGNGLKLFQAATKALEPKYNGEDSKLQYFLDAIQERSSTYGMDSILRINVGTQNNPDIRMLTSEYGSITLEQIKTHAEVYQAVDDRRRQASAILVSLISNSVNAETWDELKHKDYSVTVQVGQNPADVTRNDGAILLYQLINMVSVDTRATVSSIMKQLTGPGLSAIMESVKSDIKAFNKKVNMLMVALRARRREVPDCVPALFEAYQSCADSTFVAYIGRKEEMYEDNTIANLDNRTLMAMALEKYKTLVDKVVWMKKSKEELDFIALRSELEQTRKQLTQRPPSGARRSGTSDRSTGSAGSNSSRQGPKNDGEWAWKSIAPKDGEPKTKQFRGKKYIYCPHHGDTKWVLEVNNKGIVHATGCRAANRSESGSTATTDSGSSSRSPYRTPTKGDMAVARALASVMEDEMSKVTDTALEDEDIGAPEGK